MWVTILERSALRHVHHAMVLAAPAAACGQTRLRTGRNEGHERHEPVHENETNTHDATHGAPLHRNPIETGLGIPQFPPDSAVPSLRKVKTYSTNYRRRTHRLKMSNETPAWLLLPAIFAALDGLLPVRPVQHGSRHRRPSGKGDSVVAQVESEQVWRRISAPPENMSRNFYILAGTLAFFALISAGMGLVPSSFQPGLPANASMWRMVALILLVLGLGAALVGVMSHLFEQVDRRSDEARQAARKKRRDGK